MPKNEKALHRKSQAEQKLNSCLASNVLLSDILLLRIFSFLPLTKLNKLKRVCKRWKLLIEETLKKRSKPVYRKLFETEGWKFEKSKNGIEYVYIQEEIFLKNLNSGLSELKIEPSLCVFFLTNDFFNHQKCVVQSSNFTGKIDPNRHPEIVRRENIKEVSNQIAHLLPKNALKLFICSEGMVLGENLEYVGNEMPSPFFDSQLTPQKDPVTPAIGGLFFPRHDNYKFRIKHLSDENDMLYDIKDEKSLLKFLDVKSNESLRFLYIVITDFFGHVSEAFVSILERINAIRDKIGKNSPKNFVVVGAHVDEVFVHDSPRDYEFISDEITIVSLACKKECNETVKLAQIVLPEKGVEYDDHNSDSDEDDEDNEDDEDDEEDEENERVDRMVVDADSFSSVFAKKINALKNTEILNSQHESNTFVLMNTNIYGSINKSVNEQASLFQNEYPNLPIFGCLGFDIISHDYFPTEIGKNQIVDTNPTKLNKFNYDVKAYDKHIFESTTFTVISLPK